MQINFRTVLWICLLSLAGSTRLFASDPGRSVDCTLYDDNRRSCEALRDCTFDRRTGNCDEDRGYNRPEQCRDHDRAGDCREARNCRWDSRSRSCTSDRNAGGSSCRDIGTPIRCDREPGCGWTGRECRSDRSEVECRDIHRARSCDQTRDCYWDDYDGLCRED